MSDWSWIIIIIKFIGSLCDCECQIHLLIVNFLIAIVFFSVSISKNQYTILTKRYLFIKNWKLL